MADPWRQCATAIKAKIETVPNVGVVFAGQVGGIESWPAFFDKFTATVGGVPTIAGWRIIEGSPTSDTKGLTLGATPVLEDTLTFSVEGFRQTGEDPDTSQAAFRDVVWEVRKALDGMFRFTGIVTDPSVDYIDSWPASTGKVTPMLFGEVECWGATLVKKVRLHRTVALT